MKTICAIPAPWSPYAAAFSPDGQRLAIGGGAWYGNGGILLWSVRKQREESRWLWSEHPLEITVSKRGAMMALKPTVSGVSFSSDGFHLAASMWRSSQLYAPSVVFSCDASGLLLRHVIDHRKGYSSRFVSLGCPTAVLLHGAVVITRHVDGCPDELPVLVADVLPVDLRQGSDAQHLTHAGIIVVGGTAVTGTRSGTTKSLSVNGALIPMPPPPALTFLSLDDGTVQTLEVHDCRMISAIAVDPNSAGFVTGGSRGEVDRWSWEGGRWRQQRIRGPQRNRTVSTGQLVWDAYRPDSIVGIVTLSDRSQMVAVTAAGELIFDPGPEERTLRLPVFGSPRSIAAHPDRPWIAVGVKQGRWHKPESTVVVMDVG